MCMVFFIILGTTGKGSFNCYNNALYGDILTPLPPPPYRNGNPLPTPTPPVT